MTPRIHFNIVNKNDLTTCSYDEHVWVKLNLFRRCPELNYYRYIICAQIASDEELKSPLNRYHRQIQVVLSLNELNFIQQNLKLIKTCCAICESFLQ